MTTVHDGSPVHYAKLDPDHWTPDSYRFDRIRELVNSASDEIARLAEALRAAELARDAARADAERLAAALHLLGRDMHMGDCWAALHDHADGYDCDCPQGRALAAHRAQVKK